MADNWFTTRGATGTLPIEHRNGSWFVSSSASNEDVKCLFNDGVTFDESVSEPEVEVRVSSYKIGVGSAVNLVILSSIEEPVEPSDSEAKSEEATSTGNNTRTATTGGDTETQERSVEDRGGNDSVWNLEAFTGSGEYVTVEATIDSIHWVKKSENDIPDIKGELTDASVMEPIYFVVNEGVKHPYLEEGAKFRFEGVKDYYYTRKDQIQVVITEYTDFERLDNDTTCSSSSKQSSGSPSRSTRSRVKSQTNKSLDKIAEQTIGDKELTVTQENEDSMVSRAKQTASRQQRDPAIDPRLRQAENADEEKDS